MEKIKKRETYLYSALVTVTEFKSIMRRMGNFGCMAKQNIGWKISKEFTRETNEQMNDIKMNIWKTGCRDIYSGKLS
jgi:hypothetical protein